MEYRVCLNCGKLFAEDEIETHHKLCRTTHVNRNMDAIIGDMHNALERIEDTLRTNIRVCKPIIGIRLRKRPDTAEECPICHTVIKLEDPGDRLALCCGGLHFTEAEVARHRLEDVSLETSEGKD